MILMIDNYDSFTYNLVHYLENLGEEVVVKRNDEINLEQIKSLNPDIIVLSPGPCTPNESGVCLDIVTNFKGEFPILGVCLGHQTIAQVFGAKVIQANEPVHGRVYPITHNNTGVFLNLPNPLNVTRYHSLIVDEKTLPDCFEITAKTMIGEIMGIRHKDYMIEGVQFHPEAVLTQCGMDVLRNFLLRAKEKQVK